MVACMVGMIVFGISACGDKKNQENPVSSEESVQNSSQEEESTQEQSTQEQSTQEQTGQDVFDLSQIERVSDRADYVGIKDLEVDEYITFADYKTMQVSINVEEVSDEAIENYINSKLLSGVIMDRAVKEGDIVDIDYEGTKDGVLFDGGSAVGYRLEIGSGSFIPGFEEGLVGAMPKEPVVLNLTFPEDYRAQHMAGQRVLFWVMVNGIRTEYAKITVEDMKSLGLEYKTKEELWEAGKKAVEQSIAKEAIIQKLMEESTVIALPEQLVEEEIQNYNIYTQTLAQGWYGMSLEEFVGTIMGMDIDEYTAQIHEMAEDTVKQYLIVEAIARAEKIEITEEMIQEKAAEEAQEYGYDSADALIKDVGYTTYRISIVQEEVMNRLVEIVDVVKEEPQKEES